MKQLLGNLARLGIDGFFIALISMIILAWFFPQLGVMEQPLSLGVITDIGISGIFFFYGLKLDLVRIREGVVNWKMHLLIQSTTFLVFPLIILSLKYFFKTESMMSIWTGLFFLSALPSTVSSSVVMVSIAGGNIPGAIFNASISALIGVFITPVWIGLCISGAEGDIDSATIIIKLLVQVIAPIVIGTLLNRFGGAFANRNKKALKMFDQGVILLIVYSSFSRSFTKHLFDSLNYRELILLAIGLLALFFVIMLYLRVVSRWLGFSLADELTSLFCGSKKSLVHATVMSKVMFMNNPLGAVILLPIMMYHSLQIMVCGIIAQRFSKKHG